MRICHALPQARWVDPGFIHISQLDYFVTDAVLPSTLRDICRDNDVQVEIAAES